MNLEEFERHGKDISIKYFIVEMERWKALALAFLFKLGGEVSFSELELIDIIGATELETDTKGEDIIFRLKQIMEEPEDAVH